MKALLILNHAAGSLDGGRDSASPASVLEALHANGVPAAARGVPGMPLTEVLQAAVRERPEAVFVGGGDGSISTAAHCLAGTGIPLAVLPLGTLNHFARDLGLPLAWRDAVTVLAHAGRRAVDVVDVNGRVFVNNCSIGSYAQAVRKRDAIRRRHGMGKWWAMTLATLAVFRRLRRLRVRIEANGETRSLRSPFFVVSNNRYCGHVLGYSLRPRLDEGRLWIYTTRAHRHAAMLRFIGQSLLRELDDIDALDALGATAATMEHEYDRLPIALDGELVDLTLPLRFQVRSGALDVLAPPRRPAPT